MKLLTIFSSLLLITNMSTSNSDANASNKIDKIYLELTHKEPSSPIAIDDIIIYEVEEEADICFDTSKYLPENFNPLKGKHDIDWNIIELVDEPEEELIFDFNTKDYLPAGFDANKTVCQKKVVCL